MYSTVVYQIKVLCTPYISAMSELRKPKPLSAVEKLQHLSLVKKISQECAHYDLDDSTLAEFLLSVTEKHIKRTIKTSNHRKAVHDLQEELAKQTDKFPANFWGRLHEWVLADSPKVQRWKKKLEEKKIAERGGSESSKSNSFPGLSGRNTKAIPLDQKNSERTDDQRSRNSGKSRGVSNLPAWMTRREDEMGPPSRKRSRGVDSLEEYSIYRGKVTKTMDFGMVVEVFAGNESTEGLVKNTHLSKYRVENATKGGFRRGDPVWVKVLSNRPGNILLSTRDVDQFSGKDLMPQRSLAAKNLDMRPGAATRVVHPGLDIDALKLKEAEEEANRLVSSYGPSQEVAVRRKKHLTEHELFEAQQLIRSGVLPVEQYPTFDADGGTGMLDVEETEEETEVELSELEPAFLRGQTKLSGRDLEPTRIVKNPEGSLQRAAMQQVSMAKERRELKQAQANDLIDSIPKDINRPWEDPLAAAGERHFAQELRSINVGGRIDGAPEWKKKVERKSLSYGIISNKSIKEQREGLPVYRLKKELMEAVAKNQILVVSEVHGKMSPNLNESVTHGS